MKIYWLSFCDGDKPKGEQFLGACLVEVSQEEADLAAVCVAIEFPYAEPGSEWIGAASRKAHQMGCNPGGEMASIELPADHPNLRYFAKHVLMSREAIERIDEQIEADEATALCTVEEEMRLAR